MKRWLLVVLLVMAWPEAAFAHSSVAGLSGLYTGMLHPFASAAELLLLIALGLFVQQRLPDSELTLWGFGAGNLVGTGIAAAGYLPADVDLPLLGLTMFVGVLIISNLPLPIWLTAVTGLISGIPAGLTSWPDPGAWGAMLMTALGAIFGGFLIVMVIAAAVEIARLKLNAPWMPIAIRVAGAWVMAVAMLLGSLSLKATV